MPQFLFRSYLNGQPIAGAVVGFDAQDVPAARVTFAQLWAENAANGDRANLYNSGGKLIWDSARAALEP